MTGQSVPAASSVVAVWFASSVATFVSLTENKLIVPGLD